MRFQSYLEEQLTEILLVGEIQGKNSDCLINQMLGIIQ